MEAIVPLPREKGEGKNMTGEKYIDVDGIKTRYFEKGSGPLVVLFHGGHFGSHGAADCAEDWRLNFDGLAERFRR
jgi:2-hydroxy-6-oxonona-2,4-dienedioate hydrolase